MPLRSRRRYDRKVSLMPKAPLSGELSPQTTERFRHNYTVSLIKMQSHRGHLGKLLFKRMAELGGVQAADQLDPGALHHKTFMGQGE